jgi:hypothetical protein
MLLGSALECFRRMLDSLNDLVVSLDGHQTYDLVFTARSIDLKRPLEVHELPD